ncbi:MAG TPA: hypothetical protein VE775_00200 [Pyrinomonadaceae bacterium]|nr:hypothetical protein [Pyrinomonadaceae bacterium]
MKALTRLLAAAGTLVVLVAAGGGDLLAQRARTVSDPPQTANVKPQPTTPAPAPAPATVKAKYEGGIFGYMKKQTGTLAFDDPNRRLVFRDKQGKEYISIPYDSLAAVYGDTRSRRPTSATIIGSASIYTLPALLIRSKYRYLTLQFSDPDTRVSGVTSFKLGTKELLESMVATVAQKADMVQRGEAYVRKPRDKDINMTP